MSSALRLERLSKRFGGSTALDEVDLEVRAGEVHGLLGENGSGKSTLIKILAGFHAPEPGGKLFVRGREVPLPLSPGEFDHLGLSFVHQDLGLIPSLEVVENLFMGDLAMHWSWRISWSAERRRAADIFARYGVAIDPRARVEEITPVQRAMLAIVRALHASGRDEAHADRLGRTLLVLDEPTVFLPRAGIEQLFAFVRGIVAQGASVLFVSHDLDEVREITDRVTVLRDGRVRGTVETRDTSEGVLVEMIIGRSLGVAARGPRPALGNAHITVRAEADGLAPLEVGLARGEVLGLTGLAGSGFERLPYLIFGAERAVRGTVTIDGRALDLAAMTPSIALEQGMVLLPADRQADGSVGSLSVSDNVMLPTLGDYVRGARLRQRAMTADTRALLARFDVRPADPAAEYSTLSGGNQQKALLGKWLRLTPALLLLHEPTQGIDVGAREQIFAYLREATDRGASVVCASSDYEHLARLCDRVMIFARGAVVGELRGAEVTKEAITERCYNSMPLPPGPPRAGGEG